MEKQITSAVLREADEQNRLIEIVMRLEEVGAGREHQREMVGTRRAIDVTQSRSPRSPGLLIKGNIAADTRGIMSAGRLRRRAKGG
jgi:hypothetical protein